MPDASSYAQLVLLIAGSGLLAVMTNRVTEKIKVPTPIVVMIIAALCVAFVPGISRPNERPVTQVVSIALAFILFDGGMSIGWRRFRSAAATIVIVGVVGTFATALGAGALLHFAFAVPWFLALLVATAIAPTDPAIVFSVLGKREIEGRSSTVLEGESGANDPVGIALMAALLAAGSLSVSAFEHVGITFALEMTIGAAVGVAGGYGLRWFMRAVPLPSEALYLLRTMMVVPILFAVTILVHGSGFLAVFVAGILVGDTRAPYKREIESFHSALASLSEIVAFVVLGLTIDVRELIHADVWIPGLVLAIVTAFVIRPLVVTPLLIRSGLNRNEKIFVLFAGLKGAVPILLAEFLRAAHVPYVERWYGIVVIVVLFSVIVQGSFTPPVANWLKLPMRTLHPDPWSVGVRLRREPSNVRTFIVERGSRAVGAKPANVEELGEDFWVNFVVRHRELVPITQETTLEVGDEVLATTDPGELGPVREFFRGTGRRHGSH